MGNLISIGESGGGSLYIKAGRNINIEYGSGGYKLSVKIKKITIKVYYDLHATAHFSFDEIVHDFWGKVLEICEENDIEWRK